MLNVEQENILAPTHKSVSSFGSGENHLRSTVDEKKMSLYEILNSILKIKLPILS